MTNRLIADSKVEPWVRRLILPAYQVNDAARYAKITTQTIRNWQKKEAGSAGVLAHRAKGAALSYLQLVEVAFVSVMRRMGLTVDAIMSAREYMAQQLGAEYPFVQYKFKTDGQRIIMDLKEFDPSAPPNRLVVVNKGGQLAWKEVLKDKFEEFDYHKGLAIRWHVAGKGSPILIDPQIAFGAPAIRGVPTWAISGRHKAGESLEDIADDFQIKIPDVRKALAFEGVEDLISA